MKRSVVSTLVVVGAVVAAIPSYAMGPVSLGVLGGLNFTSQKTSVSDIDQTNLKKQLGWMGGLGADFGIGVAGLEVDALFTARKVKIGSDTVKRNALFVPALVKFGMGPVFLGVGGYYSLGLGKTTSGSSTTTVQIANIKKGDYGLSAAFGGRFENFGLEARYNYGLGNVSDETNVSTKMRSVDVLASYWF